MFADASTTAVFAFFFGLYMVSGGVGLLLDPKLYENIPEELRASSIIGYLTAVVVFAIGAMTVALHNDWTNWLAILVSLVGWAALIEGVLMLAVRRSFVAMVAKFPMTPVLLRSFGVFTIGFGILFLAGAWKFPEI
ncbi:MAG: hypothetical protein CMF74_10745 [Maricaulis sp.]|mgnify:CR=1 FL=1|jgi:hypothetical protein|nr:hypothetical protein [Maricaulis sp.]HAQ35944.1 hypothetical protein [Alphaproteobacteria bacterium]|tara:strand:- start:642 stop:1049 length:408 start_codon:yes stop_codon:yes gene_type:complete